MSSTVLAVAAVVYLVALSLFLEERYQVLSMETDRAVSVHLLWRWIWPHCRAECQRALHAVADGD